MPAALRQQAYGLSRCVSRGYEIIVLLEAAKLQANLVRGKSI